MAAVIDYAIMAGGAYFDNRPEINRFPIPDGWNRVSRLPLAASGGSGFEASTFGNAQSLVGSTEIVISFAGTDQGVDWFANGGLAFGFGADQLRQAALYYLQIKEINPAASISFTGHSLGGGLAALMGVLFDESAVTFDQAPFANSANTSVRDGIVSYLNEQGYSNIRLAALVPELFSYGGNGERSGNVTGLYVEGEALQYLPFSN